MAFVGCGGGTFFLWFVQQTVGTTYEILVACRFFYKMNCTHKLALLQSQSFNLDTLGQI